MWWIREFIPKLAAAACVCIEGATYNTHTHSSHLCPPKRYMSKQSHSVQSDWPGVSTGIDSSLSLADLLLLVNYPHSKGLLSTVYSTCGVTQVKCRFLSCITIAFIHTYPHIRYLFCECLPWMCTYPRPALPAGHLGVIWTLKPSKIILQDTPKSLVMNY